MKGKLPNRQENEFKIKIGTIALGDIFCTETIMKEKIRSNILLPIFLYLYKIMQLYLDQNEIQ